MKVAILIAIEKYADTRIRPVQFAEADAAALAEVLEQHGFSSNDRVELLSGQATKSSIESRVKRVLKQLGSDDELLCFYAGHRFSQSGANYITCYDTDRDDLADTSIELAWICNRFKDSKCKKIAFLLDSCESGMSAIDDDRDIGTELIDGELQDFFGSNEHRACLASCKINESSHSSSALKHGIWTYHIIEALDGKAPSALVRGGHLTASSLHSYLKRAVPRTLAKTFATKKIQTPWMASASEREFLIADMTTVLAKRKAAANPYAGQIKNVTLLTQRTKGVRSLSGFKNTHKEPDRLSSAAEAFITRISSEEITEDIDGVFAELKSAFKFKRADLHITNHGDGTATIITPYFNYSITIQLNPTNTSQVIFRRTVDAIKEPDQVFSNAFAGVFEGVFDTVEFDTPGLVALPALIDRIEDLDDDRITIDYDPEVTHCTLQVQGVAGTFKVTSGSLSIIHTRPESPHNLLQSFFEIQRVLVDQHDVRLIPYGENSGDRSV